MSRCFALMRGNEVGMLLNVWLKLYCTYSTVMETKRQPTEDLHASPYQDPHIPGPYFGARSPHARRVLVALIRRAILGRGQGARFPHINECKRPRSN